MHFQNLATHEVVNLRYKWKRAHKNSWHQYFQSLNVYIGVLYGHFKSIFIMKFGNLQLTKCFLLLPTEIKEFIFRSKTYFRCQFKILLSFANTVHYAPIVCILSRKISIWFFKSIFISNSKIHYYVYEVSRVTSFLLKVRQNNPWQNGS